MNQTRHSVIRFSPFLLPVLLMAGCATTPPGNDYCASSDVVIDHHFEGGNFHRCDFEATGGATVHIRPEDRGRINPSPWYAFRVSAATPDTISIRIDFNDRYARYWPKVSTDGETWRNATTDEAARSDDGHSFLLSIESNAPSVWVAGQELVTTGYYGDWVRSLDARADVDVSLLGHSAKGRPMHVAKSPARREIVYLVGRQHPPEVTGALAMRAFTDRVLGDSDLARRFRERYSLVIIPLINPDGVARGHWRHNVNGVDLNRDWGPFTQPETQAAERLIDALERDGHRPALMLDFHSTQNTLFYTQMPEETSWTIDFATVWFERFRERRPDFAFRHEARPHSGQANTKNYFYDRYRIPAITYEIGDEEDRVAIAETTPVFAEEMMRLMLEVSEADQVANRDRPVADAELPAR